MTKQSLIITIYSNEYIKVYIKYNRTKYDIQLITLVLISDKDYEKIDE